MKKIKINKSNIEKFAEEMFQFNCAHEYNSQCFSTSDIMREQSAFRITDIILEQLDKAGFDMQSIGSFKAHEWKIDDLTAPVIENPILVIENCMYEAYLDSKGITEYYTEEITTAVNIDELLGVINLNF